MKAIASTQVELAAGHLIKQAIELVADRGQPQSGEHAEQRLMVDGHHQPPPTSYEELTSRCDLVSATAFRTTM
jgi:hypothetical protein